MSTHLQISLLVLLVVLIDIKDSVGQDKRDFDDNITRENIIGHKVSDYIFNRVKNYRQERGIEQLALNELRGKWTILYFFTKNCVPCVYSFPKLNEIQEDYGTDAKVILVGIKDMWNKNIEPYFDGVKVAQRINLTVAYDSVLVQRLAIVSASTVVVINPEGMVKSVFLSDADLKKRIKTLIRRKKDRKGV